MIVFQLSFSIFISLVSRFRAGLKAEIGVFFPMIVLRVLENVAQPNYQQKMIVLRFLDNLCVDSQILVDIFLNYDCDVNSSNIFERMVNGLLKTAQGVPSVVSTTLLPPQEATMKLESMKCLVAILRSMGDWMYKQLQIPYSQSPKKSEVNENKPESGNFPPMMNGNGEESAEGLDSHSETAANEVSEASSFEQRRAYKLGLLVVMEICNMYRAQLSAKNMVVLIDGSHAVATHAHQINGDSNLRSKLQELGSMTQMQDPPLLRLENESYQTCITLLQNLILDRTVSYDEVEVEAYFVDLCKEVLQVYLNMTQSWQSTEPAIVCVHRKPHWLIPLDSVKRRELAARAPLVVSTLQAICVLGDSSFGKNLAQIFPLMAGLISCEHRSSEVQVALSEMLTSAVGPVLLQSC